MLSADVPEFVPRAYQNRGSSSNTVVSKPDETTPQPQQTTCTSRAYKPTQHSRFGSSWQEEKDKDLGRSVNYHRQNDAWRRSGSESGNWREISKHESRTETHSSPAKNPEKLILHKGRGRGKPTSREDLESQIKNKFVTASKSTSHSYTRILQNNPQNSKSDIKPSRQNFSLDKDNQWPTLGGVQPQNISDQSSASVRLKGTTSPNPWVSRSSETPPTKSPAKSPQKLRQESGAAEPSRTTAVRPKTTKGQHQASENDITTEQGTPRLQASAGSQAFLSDSRKAEGKRRHAHNNLHNPETKIQASNSDSTFTTEDKDSSGIYKDEETDKVTRNNTVDEDSDPFQWKVIGEKKKKSKVKEEEGHGSPSLQELRRDGKKYTRNPPDKPSTNVERRHAQEYSGKAKKHGAVSMFDKSVRSSLGHETHGDKKKDQTTPKSNLKEGRKPRPTKVASLANCSSDKRDVRSTAKKSTAVVTTKPMDEEALQRKLATKFIKQEEKKKKREMKAKQALALNRPKDTRVSFITTDFLEKAQTRNQKTLANQTSEQEMLQPSSSGHDVMAFTAEDYPALDMHRNTALGLSLNWITQPRTSHLQTRKSREPHPTQIKMQSDDLVPRYNKAVTRTPDKAAIASEKHSSTYKTALLAAREKETSSVQALKSTEDSECVPMETVLKKKNVKTTDRIELDIFALAAHSGKKKKKKELLAEEYSPTKRKLQQEQKGLTSKAGFAAHSLPNKGAAVVAKRGIISTKPKKKKVSRVKKCQMEKRQRDMLAVQLLLEQAKLRIAQQASLTTPASGHTEADEPCSETVGNTSTNERLSSSFMAGKDQENGDNKRRQLDATEEETQDEDNKENTRCSDVPPTAANTSTQASDKAPNDNNDKKTKVVWVLNKTENSSPQSATPRTVKADDSEEAKSSIQPVTEEGSPTSPASPAGTDPLMSDPLVVQRASELISYFQTQSNRPQGTREYVHQVVTPEVNAVAKELMTSLIAFQARHYQRDPVKARIKRRYVFGLKETTKLMKRMSCVIMAPNIEQCDGPGSLDDAVEKLLNQAETHKVPVVFALSLRAMRKLCGKKVKKVSCFGIISYQGAQDLFKRLMELLPEAQKQYQQLVACGQCSLPEEGEEEEGEEGGVDGKEGQHETKTDLTEEVIAHTNAILMAP